MRRLLPLALLVVALAVAGCLGADDDGADPAAASDLPETEEVEDALPETITGFEARGLVETEGSGTGVWLDHEADLLFATNGGGGLAIVNVSDPGDPQVLGEVTDQYARDVDVLHVDGERYAALAASGDGVVLVNATDPEDPRVVATVELPPGSHNVAVVPGEALVYNSDGGGEVWGLDVSDPRDPEVFSFPIPAAVDGEPVTTDGCHDITVRVDLGLAFCAGGGTRYGQGGGETYIWDISEDPKDPEWVSRIDDPRIFYHHQALTSADGEVLIINDEFIAPNCFREEVGPLTVQTPTAAAWFYDISDPENPEQLAHVQHPLPDEPKANCGSHFGDVVDDRRKLVMGWYQGGTMLVDFEDPAEPTILDIAEPEGSTWDARYHDGHVYGSSVDVQVLELV